jgi:hypothetical protein
MEKNFNQAFADLVLSPAALKIALWFGFIALIVHNWDAIVGGMAVFCLALGLFLIFLSYRANHRDRQVMDRLASEARQHQQALMAAFQGGVAADEFGTLVDTGWQSTRDRFLQTRIIPDSTNFNRWRRSRCGRQAMRWLEDFVRASAA